MKRRLKIAALSFGLLVVLLVGFLAWVIYTEAGLRFAVARLPERMGRVTLKIEGVHGTIAGGFDARLVEVDQEITYVRVENGRARVNFWPILVGRISVRRAEADQVLVQVKPRPKDRPKTPPKFMPGFLSISAERAATPRLVIIAPNGRRVEFSDVSGAGIVGHRVIRIFEGNIVYGFLHSRAIGELRAADPMKLRGETTTRMLIEGQPEWRADVTFDGDLDKLPLSGKLQVPFRADLRGELLELSSNFHWTGTADVHNFDLQAFGAGNALGTISGKLDIGGEMNAFHGRGPLNVPGLGAGLFDVVFAGNYADQVVNATHYEITHRATGSHAEGAGTIQAVEHGPKLGLSGTWRDLRWPLAARFTAQTPQIFSSPGGQYRLQGVWPYALSGDGELYVPRLDPMTVAMRGALHKDHLQIEELKLGAFGGEAVLAGNARWTPAQSWDLAGAVQGFNPDSVRPGLHGALDFDMKASGAPFGSDNLDFAFSNLAGKLRGSSVGGGGRVEKQGEDWHFDAVRVRAGTTSVAIDGDLGPNRALDLQFGIDADNLALLAEGARGTLHSRGRISGSSGAPVIKLIAQGAGIEKGDLKIDRLAANVDVDWRGQRTSHADISISGLTSAQRELTHFNVMLDGTTTSHTFNVDALAAQNSLHLSGKGSFLDKVWNATVSELTVDDTANLDLKLDAPAAISASAQALKVAPLCLQGKVARLCGEASWTPDAWNARADARNLPISTLTAGLTPKVEYQGTLNATARLGGTGGAPFVGEARADLVDAAIRHKLASGRTDVISFGSGYLTLDAQPDHLSGELRLDAAARGLIAGRMRAERGSNEMKEWPMRGQLQMATRELGFLTLYAPDIDRASGHFDANISLDGTLGRPRASGVVKLSNAELDLYQFNLALRALEVEARIEANDLDFSSTAKAGAGTLSSSGRIEWRDGKPYGDIRLDGENLRVVDVPEARIDASPDLDFRIAADDIFVKGEVKVPLARIRPADLTNAVLPSADEVLVGPTEEVEKEQFRVTSEITMTLGDNVTIETYGLSGHVTGSITERTLPDQPTRATGELQVKDGQYTAMARKLEIERGRLIFSDRLLVDPAVDIRAVKEFPDVKAGVNVRGTLREPRLTFFSEPSIPQSQIVSLILAGGSLESAQNQSRAGGNGGASQEVASQAAALIAAQLGNKIGIPDISVESDFDSLSDRDIGTSLVLGKYLSPRLYLSYGISLTESINTVKMRYTLDDRWTIRTEAGKERSADLVYTIEK
ncbi:MAG TPA: translocation/assembly module TamB domain-containing protein [Steroidobacteraceae bacterium]|nr:translocation/assembly module TamB domain-containing protein [Steroidobacteraceae bacterium]